MTPARTCSTTYTALKGIPLSTILDSCGLPNLSILAGRSGLSNRVKWVHCSDLPDIGYWLKGHEFLLHTGKKIQEMDLIHLIRQLHHANVAGLGIVLAKPELPKEITDLADELDFPIVFIPDQYRFADITFAISKQLFMYESSMSLLIEKFWIEVCERGLFYADIERQVAFVAEFLRQQVALYDHTLLVEYCPIIVKDSGQYVKMPESFNSLQQDDCITLQIKLNEKKLGILVMPKPASDLEIAQIHRLAPHISYMMALTLDVSSQVEDMRVGLKMSLFERLLNAGEDEMKELYAQAKKLQLDLTAEARVVTIRLPADSAPYISTKFMTDIFNQISVFIPMFTIMGTTLKMAVPKTIKKIQLEKAIRQIQHGLDAKNVAPGGLKIGIGKVSRGIKGLQESSNQSEIASDCSKENEIVWYENLNFWEILVNNTNIAKSAAEIERRLESFSTIERSKFVETISSLIQTNFNYSEASRLLGIHRNGFRERLKRYSAQIGCDLSQAEEIVSIWLVLGKRTSGFPR